MNKKPEQDAMLARAGGVHQVLRRHHWKVFFFCTQNHEVCAVPTSVDRFELRREKEGQKGRKHAKKSRSISVNLACMKRSMSAQLWQNTTSCQSTQSGSTLTKHLRGADANPFLNCCQRVQKLVCGNSPALRPSYPLLRDTVQSSH